MFSKLLFLLLLVILFQSCHHKPSQKIDGKIERNGIPISYTVCGEGDTTLLFVHGWCINKEYWEPQFNYFCPRYKVVAIDLPGFGQSGKNRTNWSFDEYAADIKSTIDKLQLKNVILIGHSMSGDIVLNVDNKYPDAVIGLVGVDNLHEPGEPMNEAQQKNTDSFFHSLSENFDATVNKYMKGNLFQPSTDSSIVNRVMNDVFTSDSLIATKVLRSLIEISQQEKPLMQGLTHKLFLVNSDVIPAKLDSLNKYCRHGCSVMTVHATGHYPMIEKPVELNAALEKVINEIGSAK